MKHTACSLLLLLALVPAHADVLLPGSQHIGNNDTKGDVGALFVPTDPVQRTEALAYPSHFRLSQTTIVTAVTLNGAVGLDGDIDVWIDGVNRSVAAVCVACSICTGRAPVCGDFTLNLDAPLTLAAGVHQIAIDPKSAGNDIGFSGITLVSAQTSTSRMFNQRRHPGNPTDPANDNDSDDNYDITDTDSPYYPDDAEGAFLEMTFNLDANRRLLQLEFYRLRDVDFNTAQVMVDGQFIGNLLDTGDPLETNPTVVSTNLLLLAGNHTLRIQLGVISGSDVDSFSWDDLILTFADTLASGMPGLFNAVNSGGNAIAGVLSTKIAAGNPGIDIVSLNTLGTALNAGYTGTVTVELMDASADGVVDAFTGCHATWSPVAGASMSVTFTAANGGRVALPGPFFSAARRKAALRMTDTATGAMACSTDRFALRPDHFTVTASQGSETTPGANPLGNTGTGGTPRHKAGQPFRIQAVAVDAANVALTGYDGTLDSTHATTALAPATVNGVVTTGAWSTSGATRTTDEARYDEVGAFTLMLKDSTYAAVDAADSTDAQRHIAGTADVGRFIPDHFAFTVDQAEFAPACSGFTYAGQAFGYTPAQVPTGRIIALTGHSTPTVTRNYTNGALYQLTAIGPTTVTAAVGTIGPATVGATLANIGNGETRVTLDPASYTFARALGDPFEADIALTLGALTETDGVAFLAAASFGEAVAGNGVDFAGNAKEIRFGRLVVDNAHGPEQFPLAVPVRAEYWEGGFRTNSLDTCTSIAAADFTVTGTTLAFAAPTLSTDPAGGGTWTFTLAQTPPAAPGAATITAVLGTNFPWLQTDDADADTNYDDDPVGLATFGLSNDQDRRIFQREVVGQ